MANQHTKQLLTLLKDQTQPINSIVIRKQLKDAGLYKQTESKQWTEALQTLVKSKQIIQVPITGQSLKHGYEINRAQTISTTEKAEPAIKTEKPKLDMTTKTTKPSKPQPDTDPLAGFKPISAQHRERQGIKVTVNSKGTVITIFKGTAKNLGVTTGDRLEVMTNQQTAEIAFVKTGHGYKLSGSDALYLKIGVTKSQDIIKILKGKIQTEIEHIQIEPTFIKAKVA